MNVNQGQSEHSRLKRLLKLSCGVLALGLAMPSAYGFQQADEGEAAEQQETRDVIVVTGIRASVTQALDLKRTSTEIVDSIVAEDIAEFPDNNVIEALQRVAGVQITDRGAGEGSALTIRGLPDATTTFNGRNVFTASGAALSLADVPANLVQRLDVYKTRSADQFAAGLAGQIDIRTRRPFDFEDFSLSAVARATYNEQSDRIDPNFSALIANRWETSAGEFGLMANVSYSETHYRDMGASAGAIIPFATADNPPPGFAPLERIFPTDARVVDANGEQVEIWQPGLDRGLPDAAGSTLNFGTLGDYEYVLARDALFAGDLYGERERPAFNIAAQWSPNANAVYTAEYLYQGFRSQTFNSLHFTFADWWGSLGADPGSTFETYEGTNVISSRTVRDVFGFQSGDFTDSQTDSHVFALNGDWTLFDDALNLVGDLSYQTSEFETAFIAMRTSRVAPELTVDFNSGNGMPDWGFTDESLLLDPSVWTVGELFDNRGRNTGDAITFSLDGDYDLDRGRGGFLQTFSAGLRWDRRGATEGIWEQPQSVGALGQPFSNLPEAAYHVNKGFNDGRSDVPTSWVLPNGYWLADNADQVRSLYAAALPALDIELSDEIEIVDDFDVEETTMSVYAMLDMQFQLAERPLDVRLGGRYTSVETDIAFTDRITGDSSDASPSSEKFLPSVLLRYEMTDDIVLRFNYGETLRRPAFAALNPNFSLTEDLTNVGYGNGDGGNPDLDVTTSKNYDFSAEWYFGDDDAFYVTVFRREVDGLVVPLNRRITIPNDRYNTDLFVVSQPVNASDGVLEGAEIGLTYFPDNLPGLLDGFGVLGSVTFLDSEQNIPLTNSAGEIVGEENTSFFGVSDFSYNATLAYENEWLGARLSYVYREDFLNANEERNFANPIGIWRRPEKSLDLAVNLNLRDNVSVTFDAVNITDEVQQEYYAFGDAGGPDIYNFRNLILGRTFTVGVKYDF
ncbi:TonB-dependent receptor [Oceanicaulis sp.]|uniref:TonB-dependent receptor n=1 Tax=Oceanicaulis sp. TaxID=1924941 RepID=UPI003F6F882B